LLVVPAEYGGFEIRGADEFQRAAGLTESTIAVLLGATGARRRLNWEEITHHG
jgi:hypothetical protein